LTNPKLHWKLIFASVVVQKFSSVLRQVRQENC
jgi:hypothetical protein